MQVVLRGVEEADLPALLRWRNSPEIARHMYTDHVITEQEHWRWFQDVVPDSTRRYWATEVEGALVGLLWLFDIDLKDQRTNFGFYVGESSMRGTGVGSWMECQMLLEAFDSMGLQKVHCEVLSTNPDVIRMHQGFGFKQEGVLRQHVVKSDQRVDIHCMGMLREDWRQVRTSVMSRLASLQQRWAVGVER
jgi:UDP-4-amino-4,6-dideoxy-N-acetyl-beta-L-altrosamine N-acetyltransferase